MKPLKGNSGPKEAFKTTLETALLERCYLRFAQEIFLNKGTLRTRVVKKGYRLDKDLYAMPLFTLTSAFALKSNI